MSYYTILQKRINRDRQELEEKLDRILRSKKTRQIYLSDYPLIQEYLNSRFPNIDVSAVKIYVSTPKVISAAGFPEIGGCYIRHLKLILLKNKMTIGSGDFDNKFDRLLNDSVSCSADVEDVLVHELLHAVSDAAGRSLSRYEKAEEEFVYSTSLDFLLSKGMTEDDAINNNFIPFFLNSVMANRKVMSGIFVELKRARQSVSVVPTEEQFSSKRVKDFMSKYANFIVPRVIDSARQKAQEMIDRYREHGLKSLASSDNFDRSMRFSSIDFE